MATYPIDIEPRQIVRWLMAEQQATPSLFHLEAQRASEVHKLPRALKYRLGDAERDSLSEVETIATLDVSPAHTAEGWTLTITVEDEAGPREVSQRGTTDAEHKIDLGSFYRQFIRPGRGIATASAEVRDAVAEQHLKTLLDAILTNHHPTQKMTRHRA